MFILFGSKGYQVELGEVISGECECPSCQNDIIMQVFKVGRNSPYFSCHCFLFLATILLFAQFVEMVIKFQN